MDEPQRSAIVLATHEAVANAIEHAGATGSIVVSADERLGTFAVDVSDDSHWKSPMASPERGRGLTLKRGLVSVARIVTGESGTTVHLCQRLPERTREGVRRSGARPAAV
jgi:anti-sigma regulatory factor (Ser/Thr protein kinase)